MSNDIKEELGIEEEKPADWFEPLYAGADRDGTGVPWANMVTHPSFAQWLTKYQLDGVGSTALVIGCGMGDDAVELESFGFDVTAFDVSASAIQYCKERFPDSKVNFLQADLLKEQPHWDRQFDFVLEIFTVQALPPKYEEQLIENISKFVALNGQLLVIAEVKDEQRSYQNGPPWLLSPQHIDMFRDQGLDVVGQYIESSSLDDELSNTYITTFKNNAS